MTTRRNARTTVGHRNEIAAMLEDRRRQLVDEVQDKIRDARTDNVKEGEVLDAGESSDVDVQDEIEFALLQMKSETLVKIDAALRQLDAGTYGECFDCGNNISDARLRALPFAVRCRDCEEHRESTKHREQMTAQRRGSSALYTDTSSA